MFTVTTKEGGSLTVEDGKFSVSCEVDRSQNPPVLTVTGYIETIKRLPDRFSEIKGGRVTVYDVTINSESIGSEDNTIVYGFKAKRYAIWKIKEG